MFGISRFNSGWTAEGVTELLLWFRGESTNVAEPLYVAVANAAGTLAVVVQPKAELLY
jgi:hypothetical protein